MTSSPALGVQRPGADSPLLFFFFLSSQPVGVVGRARRWQGRWRWPPDRHPRTAAGLSADWPRQVEQVPGPGLGHLSGGGPAMTAGKRQRSPGTVQCFQQRLRNWKHQPDVPDRREPGQAARSSSLRPSLCSLATLMVPPSSRGVPGPATRFSGGLAAARGGPISATNSQLVTARVHPPQPSVTGAFSASMYCGTAGGISQARPVVVPSRANPSGFVHLVAAWPRPRTAAR